jgi:hypothetical protein
MLPMPNWTFGAGQTGYRRSGPALVAGLAAVMAGVLVHSESLPRSTRTSSGSPPGGPYGSSRLIAAQRRQDRLPARRPGRDRGPAHRVRRAVGEPRHPRPDELPLDVDLDRHLHMVGFPCRVAVGRRALQEHVERPGGVLALAQPGALPRRQVPRDRRCTVAKLGGGGPPAATAATSSRCSAATVPRQYASRRRSASPATNRARPGGGPVRWTGPGPATATSSARTTPRWTRPAAHARPSAARPHPAPAAAAPRTPRSAPPAAAELPSTSARAIGGRNCRACRRPFPGRVRPRGGGPARR